MHHLRGEGPLLRALKNHGTAQGNWGLRPAELMPPDRQRSRRKGLNRRRFLQLAAAGGVLAALEGCAPPPPAELRPAKPPVAAGPSSDPQFLHFHVQGGLYGEVAQARAAEYREARPEVRLHVEVTDAVSYVPRLEARMAAAEDADCFWLPFGSGDFHRLARSGLLSPLTAWLDSAADGPYLQQALDAGTFQGQPMALPWACHPGRLGCYVNLDILDAAGLEPPPPDGDWTWPQLRDLAVAATRPGPGEEQAFGVNLGLYLPHIHILIRSLGGEFFNDYGNRVQLRSAEVMEALTLLHGLLHADGAMPLPGQLADFHFERGNVALSQNAYWGAWLAENAVEKPFSFAVVPLPHGPEGQTGAMLEIDPLCLLRVSPHLAEAWDWMRFLTDQTTGLQLAASGGAPGARADVWDDEALQGNAHSVFADALDLAAPYARPANLRVKEVSNIFDEGMTACWLAGEEPARIVPVLERRLNSVLAQAPA